MLKIIDPESTNHTVVHLFREVSLSLSLSLSLSPSSFSSALPWPCPVSLASSFLLLNLLEQIVRDEDDDQMDPEMFCAVMQRAHLDRPSNLNHVCIPFFLLTASMHISVATGCVCAYELQQPLLTSLFIRYCNRGKVLGRRPFNDSLRRQLKLLAAYWMHR